MLQYSECSRIEWDKYKDVIAQLYKEKELKDVMLIMEAEYGFKASESQYKSIVTKWGFHKKISPNTFSKEDTQTPGSRKRQRGVHEEEPKFVIYDQSAAKKQDLAAASETVQEDDNITQTLRNESSLTFPCQTSLLDGIHAGDNNDAEILVTPIIPPNASICYVTERYESAPLNFNKYDLEHLVRQFGQWPSDPDDQRLLDIMISFSRLHYDEYCTECTTFGYDSKVGGCEIHRCLSRILAQYRFRKIALGKALMLCRGAIPRLLSPEGAPLASIARIAVDIIWLSLEAKDLENIRGLASMLQIPNSLLYASHSFYRSLVAHCALILARCGDAQQANITLKSCLGPDYDELHRAWLKSNLLNFNSSTLTLENAVTLLTAGGVRTSKNESGWAFSESDIDPNLARAHNSEKRWYRLGDGGLNSERLIVSGIALKALVEIEHQHRLRGINKGTG